MSRELHNTLPHMEITATSDGYCAVFVEWLTPDTQPRIVAAEDIAEFLFNFGGAVWSDNTTVIDLIEATGCTRFERL
jgi:hypothetical protein